MDKLLGSNINFLLGNWVEGAVAWAKDPSEIPGLRFNALNQITLWGPDGQSTCAMLNPVCSLTNSQRLCCQTLVGISRRLLLWKVELAA